MNGWIVWCALAGLVLGIRWPVQAVVVASAAVFVVGLGYGLQWGLGTGFAAGLGGAIIVQFAYVISMLASSLIPTTAISSSVLQRAPSRR